MEILNKFSVLELYGSGNKNFDLCCLSIICFPLGALAHQKEPPGQAGWALVRHWPS